MWEVVWTDPDKESRREHRERKAVQKEQKDKNRARSSASTRSSTTSESKAFGFFGSKNLKRTTASRTKSSAAALLANPHHESKARRVSYLSTAASATSAGSAPLPSEGSGSVSDPVQPSAAVQPDQYMDSFHNSPGSSARDSVFSEWSGNSPLPSGSPNQTSLFEISGKPRSTQYIQTLGPSSYIMQNTEVIVTPRTSTNDVSGVVSEVKITACPAKEEAPTPPQSPAVSSNGPPIFDFPVNLFPGQTSPPRSPSTRRTSWASNFKPNNPDAWKPPEAWDCLPSSEKRASTFEDIMEEPGEQEPEDDMALSLDLNSMQREVKRMAAASPTIRLIRLKEPWGVSDDANLYRELEMEKKRWVLSSLDNMDKPIDVDPAKPAPLKATAAKTKKVLALYETQATTSYLAALHYNKNIYHMSPTPLSHDLFPNIHPVLVPTISATAFPVAQGLFGAVHSLSLPSLVSSSEVSTVLKNIHRALALGGTFHLTLIDPQPSAMTLGPRLRAWLDKHLLFNLEKNFRCMSPSKLFPIWLGDASLRAEGSTITSVKFPAIPQTTHESLDLDTIETNEKSVRQELRSLVGRMLWMEVWGQYIQADTWWWEDPQIVQECHEMHTTWEYLRIEAVKDN